MTRVRHLAVSGACWGWQRGALPSGDVSHPQHQPWPGGCGASAPGLPCVTELIADGDW